MQSLGGAHFARTRSHRWLQLHLDGDASEIDLNRRQWNYQVLQFTEQV